MTYLSLTVLSGCSGDGSIERERLANLTSAVEEFDAASISEIICEASGGEVAFARGFDHTMVLADSESMDAVVQRFTELDYTRAGSPPEMSLSRSDGVRANVHDLSAAEALETFDAELKAIDCAVPDSGGIWIRFSER